MAEQRSRLQRKRLRSSEHHQAVVVSHAAQGEGRDETKLRPAREEDQDAAVGSGAAGGLVSHASLEIMKGSRHPPFFELGLA